MAEELNIPNLTGSPRASRIANWTSRGVLRMAGWRGWRGWRIDETYGV